MLGYLASALWVGEIGGWRNMYGAAFIPALILAAGMVITLPALARSAMLCHALPCCAVLRHVLPCPGFLPSQCLNLCLSLPGHALPCSAMLCHALPFHQVRCQSCACLCPVMLCHALPCFAMLCHALPCFACSAMLVGKRNACVCFCLDAKRLCGKYNSMLSHC